jgi:hypothetical protein
MFDTEPERWVGLLTALGVLLPAALWFVLDRLRPRGRNVVTAVGATFLLVAAAQALTRTSILGFLLGYGESFGEGSGGRGGRTVADVLLLLVGLAAGLALALALRVREPEPAAALVDEPAEEADEDSEDSEESDDDEPVTGDTEVVGADAKAAYWSSHVSDAPARAVPAVPVGPRQLLFLVVALGLALPALRFGLDASFLLGSIFRGNDVNALMAFAMLLEGAITGFALLAAAMWLGKRDLPMVAAGFVLVALGQGLASSFPDTFSNEFWFATAIGLTAGLLLPSALRLLSGLDTEDRAALATAVVVAVALLAGVAVLQARAMRSGVESVRDGVDFDEDDLVVPSYSPPPFPTELPTLPPFPTGFPSGFPTEFPTEFPFPSGFPTAFLTPSP